MFGGKWMAEFDLYSNIKKQGDKTKFTLKKIVLSN